jgi:hypothetical protein
MSCNDKIKQKCGVKVYAPCVQYELDIPAFSSLSIEQCTTIEETTDDLYGHIGDIKEEIDLSELGLSCLQYVPTGQIAKVKNILLKYESEICTLKTQVETLQTTSICDKDITQCGIDLTGITDICDNPITKLGELLNYLVLQSNP